MTFASGMRVRRSRIPTALEDGGTGSRTREEAVAALGVPSLTADNTFTANNTFTGAVALNGSTSMALGDSYLPIANSADKATTLDFTGVTAARNVAFQDASGTLALTGDPLQVPYKAQGSTYAASRTDCVINCTGTWTLTLPTAVGFSGQMYFIKNSGAGTVTMAGTGGQTFDGVASPTVAAGASLTVCSDGANWIIL